jgi:hypothetical protein
MQPSGIASMLQHDFSTALFIQWIQAYVQEIMSLDHAYCC